MMTYFIKKVFEAPFLQKLFLLSYLTNLVIKFNIIIEQLL